MKTAGIAKTLALTGALAGAGALTGCTGKAAIADIARNKSADNVQYLKDNDVTARIMDSLENESNSATGKAALEVWQEAKDEVYWTKRIKWYRKMDSTKWSLKMDSAVAAAKQLGKQAAIDSVEAAKRIAK